MSQHFAPDLPPTTMLPSRCVAKVAASSEVTVAGISFAWAMIRLVARVLAAHCDARRDFLGHVGGDDFVVLFQSQDWEQRCHRIVDAFNSKAREPYDPEALAAGGIHAEDRHGDMRFHPCTTLSIGAVQVQPGHFAHAEDVASAAATAKRHAKHSGRGVVVLDAREALDSAPVALVP